MISINYQIPPDCLEKLREDWAKGYIPKTTIPPPPRPKTKFQFINY